MSRCEQWFAATMKLVWWGTWFAPLIFVSRAPL